MSIVFTFGSGGFRTTRMGGVPRQQQQQGADRNQLLTLLPVLFIFFFPFFSSIISSLFSTPPIPDPLYAFKMSKQFATERLTTPHKVAYYVDEKQFSKHPIWESLSPEAQQSSQAGKVSRSPQLYKFEKRIEEHFAQYYWDSVLINMTSSSR